MRAWAVMTALAVAIAAPAYPQKGATITPVKPKPGQVTPAPDTITPAGIPQSVGTLPAQVSDNEMDVCILDVGYLMRDGRLAATGLARSLNGKYVRYLIGADGMRMRQTQAALDPVYPPGAGMDGGEEADLAKLLERAAEGGWVMRIAYDPIGTQEYRVISVNVRPRPQASCS